MGLFFLIAINELSRSVTLWDVYDVQIKQLLGT